VTKKFQCDDSFQGDKGQTSQRVSEPRVGHEHRIRHHVHQPPTRRCRAGHERITSSLYGSSLMNAMMTPITLVAKSSSCWRSSCWWVVTGIYGHVISSRGPSKHLPRSSSVSPHRTCLAKIWTPASFASFKYRANDGHAS